LSQVGLEVEEVKLDSILREDRIEGVWKTSESGININKLSSIVENKLKKYNVLVKLRTCVSIDDLKTFDKIVLATYWKNNEISKDYNKGKVYQYELCEKPVVQMGKEFSGKSLVIMDGPFMCLDPIPETSYHTWGNVIHAIHHSKVSKTYTPPYWYQSYLKEFMVTEPKLSNFNRFNEMANYFLKGNHQTKWIGSKYVIKIKPSMHYHDDIRPTEIDIISEKIISILSGKIANASMVARKVMSLL
jgi:hypothetical protein